MDSALVILDRPAPPRRLARFVLLQRTVSDRVLLVIRLPQAPCGDGENAYTNRCN